MSRRRFFELDPSIGDPQNPASGVSGVGIPSYEAGHKPFLRTAYIGAKLEFPLECSGELKLTVQIAHLTNSVTKAELDGLVVRPEDVKQERLTWGNKYTRSIPLPQLKAGVPPLISIVDSEFDVRHKDFKGTRGKIDSENARLNSFLRVGIRFSAKQTGQQTGLQWTVEKAEVDIMLFRGNALDSKRMKNTSYYEDANTLTPAS